MKRFSQAGQTRGVKELMSDQVQDRKDKAVLFLRNVVQDFDRADEVEEESLESYAERRGFEIVANNPERRQRVASKAELEQLVQELEAENEELQDQLDSIADIAAPPEDEVEGEEGEENPD